MLKRMLDLAGSYPLTLAVIPARLELELVEVVRERSAVTVAQHGWQHRNYSKRGHPGELGDARPIGEVKDDLKKGAVTLANAFGQQFCRVVVPPWNRIGKKVAASLRDAGFDGLSVAGPRPSLRDLTGLCHINVHVDLIDWTKREFIGVDESLRRIVWHLRARRTGKVDPDEPIGILTHHAFHTPQLEDFLAALLEIDRQFSHVSWLRLEEALRIA